MNGTFRTILSVLVLVGCAFALRTTMFPVQIPEVKSQTHLWNQTVLPKQHLRFSIVSDAKNLSLESAQSNQITAKMQASQNDVLFGEVRAFDKNTNLIINLDYGQQGSNNVVINAPNLSPVGYLKIPVGQALSGELALRQASSLELDLHDLGIKDFKVIGQKTMDNTINLFYPEEKTKNLISLVSNGITSAYIPRTATGQLMLEADRGTIRVFAHDDLPIELRATSKKRTQSELTEFGKQLKTTEVFQSLGMAQKLLEPTSEEGFQRNEYRTMYFGLRGIAPFFEVFVLLGENATLEVKRWKP
jgi:hypothetical protein